MSTTLTFKSHQTKEHIHHHLRKTFSTGVVFTLQDVCDLVLNKNRIPELYDGKNEESVVRAALQRLEEDGVLYMMFRDDRGLRGKYILIDSQKQNPNQTKSIPTNSMTAFQNLSDNSDTVNVETEAHIRFVIQQLEQKAPRPEGDHITFVRWDCITKDKIIDHEEAVKLKLKDYFQQRHGSDLDHDTVAKIKESIKIKGWLYNVPQPSVSELNDPIMGSDGKMKYYVLRNGRHRKSTEIEYLPCSVINAPHEDYYQKFGTTSNNPDGVHICNFTTEEDAMFAIRDWIRKGYLEPNLDDVKQYLKDWYPHIKSSNRVGFASKILEAEGYRESIRSWTQSGITDFIRDTFNITAGVDDKSKVIRYVSVMNNSNDDIRLMEKIMEDMINIEYEDFSFEIYSSLYNRTGKDEEVTSNNITQLRLNNEAKWAKFVANCCKLAKRKSRGTMSSVTYNWVYQDNNNEDDNDFHL